MSYNPEHLNWPPYPAIPRQLSPTRSLLSESRTLRIAEPGQDTEYTHVPARSTLLQHSPDSRSSRKLHNRRSKRIHSRHLRKLHLIEHCKKSPSYNDQPKPAQHASEQSNHDFRYNIGLGISEETSPPDKRAEKKSSLNEKDSWNVAQYIETKYLEFSSSDNVLQRWAVEFASWTISALTMSVIIGILISVSNKPLPNWPVNTILNGLYRVAAAALLLPTAEALGQLKWSWFQRDSQRLCDFEIFDRASRGAFGSFMLLIRLKGRSLATIGAAVTLLALGLDPFFQQLTDFSERQIVQGIGKLSKTVQYSPWQQDMRTVDGFFRILDDLGMTNAIDPFFFSNDTKSDYFKEGETSHIPLTCPTSNCSWPVYESLAVCSSCKDILTELVFSCLDAPALWYKGLHVNYTVPGIGDPNAPNITSCGYFLNSTSDYPLLVSGYSINSTEPDVALTTMTFPLTYQPIRQEYWGGSIHYKDISDPIVDFIIAATPKAAVYRNETPEAYECIFNWCVNTLESSYTLGKYTENIRKTYQNTSGMPHPWNYSFYKNLTLSNYRHQVNISLFNGNKTESYGMPNNTAVRTVIAFEKYLPSYYTVDKEAATTVVRFANFNTLPLLRSLKENPWLPPNNIPHRMEQLAASLTKFIRTSSYDVHEGTAFANETYVHVKWEWLTLPLTLLLISLIFLLAVVKRSLKEQGRVGIWKTSAMAPFLYGLPEEVRNRLLATTGSPRMHARELRVKLHPHNDGWRMSCQTFSPGSKPQEFVVNPPNREWRRTYQLRTPHSPDQESRPQSFDVPPPTPPPKASRRLPPPGWI